MSRRTIASRTRTVLTLGTLITTMAVTNVLPALTHVPDVAQAGSRHGQRQTVSAERKKGGKNQRNVTKTFNNDVAISIPDARVIATDGPANPYPSPITVSGIKQGRVVDVNLTLRGFSHTFPADVDLLLVAPDGTNALVMADAGESNPDGAEEVVNLTLTLDDEAAQPLPVEALLTSGTFRPFDGGTPGPNGDLSAFPAPAPSPGGAVALSTFDGINPNGEWQLFVLDDEEDDAGAFAQGWSLEITASTKTKSQHKKGRH
jgi:subtilisin-like proprotein convertase family protein